ncbi:Eukaryotic translation initiation factor 2c [Fasciola gigantica]|uniref:Eukaryotic translation initiation factor 2c n=1 Tax=Fasciola gigantica TaxID=46835 RepID=A0A504Y882_FASGI|nr:Eukaryotic translation initiation factor 2c [Fasciola gigantica]
MEEAAGPSESVALPSQIPSTGVEMVSVGQQETDIPGGADKADVQGLQPEGATVSGGRKKRGKKKSAAEPSHSVAGAAFSSVVYGKLSNLQRTDRQLSVSMPQAPDKGTIGRPRTLVSNCWNMTFQPKTVYMYDAEVLNLWRFDDTGRQLELRASPKEKRKLLGIVVSSFPEGILFDGGRIIYSDNPLPDVTDTGIDREFIYDDSDLLERRKLKYKIIFTGRRNTVDIVEFLERPNGQSVCSLQDSLRILDCAAKLACEGPFRCLGRMAIFDLEATKKIFGKLLQIHRGFIMTVRPQWKLRINVDMTFKAFFPSGNLADILYEKYGDDMCLHSEAIYKDISGIRLQSPRIYRKNPADPPHVRLFTAHGVSKLPASKLMIEDINQTVKDYFNVTYGHKLQYSHLPCIKVKKDRDVFYPMELLEVIPFQNPKNTTDLAAEVIRCSAVRPEERFRELEKFCRSYLVRGPALLRRYGMSVLDGMQSVAGRELPTPAANFGGGHEPLGRGKWFVKRFHSSAYGGQAIRFIVISLPPNPREDGARRSLAAELEREGRSKGMHFQLVGDFSLQPQELAHRMASLSSQADLVIFILGNKFSYSHIKVLGDITLGVRTQCIQSATLRKRGVIGNLLLKINAKLDGINWVLQPFDNGEHIMVFGADVTHPSPTGNQLRRSVGAVTGSLSDNLMQYRAIIFQQMTNRPQQTAINEVINDMQSITLELLKDYSRRNNGPPSRLIFYRDGVSEGQFEKVLLEELAGIQRACIDLGREIPITFIVVQKRHHIRLKPQDDAGNVAAGTVVDTEITMKSEFDFYLCSQEGIQGTSRPAHYRVLYDDNNYRSDALQMFTFALCHAYARCSRSVSYPAPTYYSHLAAFRGRDWLTSNEDEKHLIKNGRFLVNNKQLFSLFFC